jgi:hypothetical protein
MGIPFHSVMHDASTIVLPDVYGPAIVICETNVIELKHHGS